LCVAKNKDRSVDHYIQFFKRVQANSAPRVVPPLASTDGVHFDRQPAPDQRAALIDLDVYRVGAMERRSAGHRRAALLK
jgi:hypothetical protein